jgi:methyl-accepting chemotaxis protein
VSWTAGAVALIAYLATNYGLARLVRSGWYRSWLVHCFAALDLILAGLVIACFGAGGLVLAIPVVVLPYSELYGRPGWVVPSLATATVYIGAVAAHRLAFEAPGESMLAATSPVYIEAALTAVVTWVLGAFWSSWGSRLSRTRAVMAQWESGSLEARVPTERSDRLGQLERTVNQILDQVSRRMAHLDQAARQLSSNSAQAGLAAQRLAESSQGVVNQLRGIIAQMRSAGSVAEDKLAALEDLGRTAEALGSRAELAALEGGEAVDSVARSYDQVNAISGELGEYATGAQGTVAAVGQLSGSFKRVAEFAAAIGKIARQTHVLALNAAIEAARAADHGQGFAVVAEQVRTLAAEAGRSAREVEETVGEMKEGIDRVAETIAAGEQRIGEVAKSASEACATLSLAGPSLSQTLSLASETATASRKQSQGFATLASEFDSLTAQRDRWQQELQELRRSLESHLESLAELERLGSDLAQLGEGFRAAQHGSTEDQSGA